MSRSSQLGWSGLWCSRQCNNICAAECWCVLTEASPERERERKGEREIAGSGGVRRGVWHPLSCLLKASFFPSLPPPHAADRRYFQRPRSAVLCLLHRLLEGSQKLKPGGVNRLFRFVTQWGHPKGKKRVQVYQLWYVGLCTCMCTAEHNLCVHVHLLMKAR